MKEFELKTNKNQLNGSCYLEFFPGENNHSRWNEESVYIHIDGIDIIYDIFLKVNKHFDQYCDTYFHKMKLGFLIRELSIRIYDIKNNNIINKNKKYNKLIKYMAKNYYEYINDYINEDRNNIIIMLEELLKWIKKNLRKGITVFGV